MSTRNTSLIFTMITALIIFVLVTFVFTASNGYGYDQSVVEWVNGLTSPIVEKVMEFISLLGSSEVILIATFLIAGILVLKRNWIMTFFFLTVSVGGVALNLVLKLLFQRERPGGEVKLIEVFNFSLEIPSYSFPSGHTMRITILLLFLIYISFRFIQKTSIKIVASTVCILTMVGVALSRLFLEAHFLSDTLGAMSISLAWFAFCLLLFKRYEAKRAPIVYRQW